MQILKSIGERVGWQRVFLAIPTTSSISAETTYSLFGSKEYLLKNKIESELSICAHDCHVDDQRNALVREFLESSCDQFVFIDSDILFNHDDLLKLIQYDVDIVAGVYPKKSDDIEFPVRIGENPEIRDGLVKVDGVPTGFLKISRRVLEKLYETQPKYANKIDGDRKIKIPLIFQRSLEGNVRWGGDYQFCELAKKHGFEIFVDPHMYFGHVGTKTFSGSLEVHLCRERGMLDDHILRIVRKIQHGDDVVDDYKFLHEAWGNRFTVGPELLAILSDISAGDDGDVLEIGTGLTTLVIGASGRNVTCIEHDAGWLSRINHMLDLCNFTNVNVINVGIKDRWYDYDITGDYSMILIDGPPRKIGDRKNFCSKIKKIKKGCVVIVDDADTETELIHILSDTHGVQFVLFGRYAIGVKK